MLWDCGTLFKKNALLLSRFVGQWDTVLKGRVNLVTDQMKRTVSVVGLWDTLLKEMLLYRADPSRFVGQWDIVLKGRVNLVTDQHKKTQSVVGLWDTLLKDMLLH